MKKNPDAIRVADGVLFTYTAPARWQGKDWVKLGGVVAGTAALTLADKPVRTFWQKHDPRILDGFSEVGYHYGKHYTSIILTGGVYLSGLAFKNEWARETGLILGTSLFSAGMLQMGMKPLIGRARPSMELDNYEFRPWNSKNSFHSFPSGHSTMAFTISMVMSRQTKSIPLKVFFYSLAATTVVNRLYEDEHWISDVAFGGTIAWFCSDIAMQRLSVNKYRPSNAKWFQWNVYPYPSGLTVRATF